MIHVTQFNSFQLWFVAGRPCP